MIAWSNDGTDTLFATSGWIIRSTAIAGGARSTASGTWQRDSREPPPPMKKCMELTKAAFGQQDQQRIEAGRRSGGPTWTTSGTSA